MLYKNSVENVIRARLIIYFMAYVVSLIVLSGASLSKSVSCDYNIEDTKNYLIDGDFSEVRELIKIGCMDVNYEYKNGFTPLSYAAFSGDVLNVRKFIEMGADVNQNNCHALSSAMTGFDLYIDDDRTNLDIYDKYSSVMSEIINSGAKLDYVYENRIGSRLVTNLLHTVCGGGIRMCIKLSNSINKNTDVDFINVSEGELLYIERILYVNCPCLIGLVEKMRVELY